MLITIDTLRADRVGAYGADPSPTPTLDQLAAEGLRFAVAISPAPLTLPSHTTILTGADPPQHGVHENGTFRAGPELVLLPEPLQDAGFATGAFVGAIVLDRQYGLDQGFDRYDDEMADRNAAGEAGFAERRGADVVDAALEWALGSNGNFFLWVHLYDPHAVYDPPAGFSQRWKKAPYEAEIAYADAQVGRLLAAIDERWPDGRTTVAVTSDHGEGLGEHDEPTHGYGIFETTQRVPLLLRGPGVPTGQVVTTPVRLADIAPTLWRTLGVSASEAATGRDLLALARETSPAQVPAYMESLAGRFGFGWSAVYGIRDGDWKYVRSPKPALFDLANDPGELENLVAADPDRASQLDRSLSERLSGAPAATPGISPNAGERDQLAALGYVVGASAEPVPLGEVGGIDPHEGSGVWLAFDRALLLAEAGQSAEAIEVARSLPATGHTAGALRIEIALQAGHLELAERWAREALAEGHPLMDLEISLGQSLERQGRHATADAAYDRAAALNPASGEPAVGRGRVAERRGDAEAAAAWYGRARSQRGGSLEAIWRLAALEIEARDREKSAALLAELPPDAFRSPRIAARIARAELASGQPERAATRLAPALHYRPRHAELRALAAEIKDALTEAE